MVESVDSRRTWIIEYTDTRLESFAAELAVDLRAAQIDVPDPEQRPPSEATLGAPEIVITILVTAAVKSVVVAGLHALQRYLESTIDSHEGRLLQVVLPRPGLTSKRFPVDTKHMAREAIAEFVSEIIEAVQSIS